MNPWKLAWAGLALLAGTARADIVVKDETGAALRLASPATRIVSLAPHSTETLFAAGAGAKVVGAVEYSDYPPAAARIPRVGGYKSLDIERIAALHPDLVVAWKSGTPPATVDKLRQLGLTVYLSDPRKLEDVAEEIERLGMLAGTETPARAAGSEFRKGVESLRKRYAAQRPVSVFYQVWNRPLMTINDDHTISDVIRLCGGRNVFADLKTQSAAVSLEAVLTANPDAIVASGMGEERPDWLDQWKQWPRLIATQRNTLYFVPPALIQRPTPRLLQGAQRLCEALEDARKRVAGTAR